MTCSPSPSFTASRFLKRRLQNVDGVASVEDGNGSIVVTLTGDKTDIDIPARVNGWPVKIVKQ